MTTPYNSVPIDEKQRGDRDHAMCLTDACSTSIPNPLEIRKPLVGVEEFYHLETTVGIPASAVENGQESSIRLLIRSNVDRIICDP